MVNIVGNGEVPHQDCGFCFLRVAWQEVVLPVMDAEPQADQDADNAGDDASRPQLQIPLLF